MACAVALFALISDWMDGYLARLWRQVSSFGICFDPIADKAFIISAFVSLICHPYLGLPLFPLVLIIVREMGVSGLRIVILTKARSSLAETRPLAAERFGKIKSAVQFGVILFFTFALWGSYFEGPRMASEEICSVLFWAVAIMTLLSGLPYFWKHRTALARAWQSIPTD